MVQFLIGNFLFAQEISKETLRAINEGNITLLDKVISKESLNDCFDIKRGLQNTSECTSISSLTYSM